MANTSLFIEITNVQDPYLAKRALTVPKWREIYENDTLSLTDNRFVIELDEARFRRLSQHPWRIPIDLICEILHSIAAFRSVTSEMSDLLIRNIVVTYRLYDTANIAFSTIEHFLWTTTDAERQRLVSYSGFTIEKGMTPFDIIAAMLNIAGIRHSIGNSDDTMLLLARRDPKAPTDWPSIINTLTAQYE